MHLKDTQDIKVKVLVNLKHGADRYGINEVYACKVKNLPEGLRSEIEAGAKTVQVLEYAEAKKDKEVPVKEVPVKKPAKKAAAKKVVNRRKLL